MKARPCTAILLTCVHLLPGCVEGPKELLVWNRTKAPVLVTTRPEPEPGKEGDTVPLRTDTLPGGEVLVISHIFTYLIPKKLRAGDLQIDYVRIETPTDTIVAGNRQAIIALQRKNTIVVE